METIRGIYIPEVHLPATIISFKVTPGDDIEKYQVVCLYEHTSTEEVKTEHDPDFPKQESDIKLVIRNIREELNSPYEGTIEKLEASVGDRITENSQAILTVKEPCSHGMQFNGLCADCAKDWSV
ncbi:CTD phosphatase Fcp1, partial [Basidiobolus ranarum]